MEISFNYSFILGSQKCAVMRGKNTNIAQGSAIGKTNVYKYVYKYFGFTDKIL